MDLLDAAKRHRRCAQKLAAGNEVGEACYLIGLAAECAIKYHLQTYGHTLQRRRKNISKKIKDLRDPVYLHFPDLKTEILSQGEGVIIGGMMKIINDHRLFAGWTIKMRYARQRTTTRAQGFYELWSTQTENIFRESGIQ